MPDDVPSCYVVIDDTDPRISYEGQWSLDTSGGKDGLDWSNRGPTWNRTLMGAQGKASFSLRFNGTYFRVYGTYDIKEGRPKPKWRCQVDGVTIDNNQISAARANSYGFCRHPVRAGEHTVTVNITVPQNGSFWLDHIDYAPLSQPTRDEVLLYQNYDTSVIYDPRENWKTGYGGSGKATRISGSTATMNFSGVKFTAFGSAPGNTTNTAQYSIDDGLPVNFTVPTTPPGMSVLLSQPLFTASNLSSTAHRIVITFTGNTSGTPLDYGYAMITLPPTVNIDPPLTSYQDSRPSTSAIAGGAAGGAAGLVLLICFSIFLSKRARCKRAERMSDSGLTPIPFTGYIVDDALLWHDGSHDFSKSG